MASSLLRIWAVDISEWISGGIVAESSVAPAGRTGASGVSTSPSGPKRPGMPPASAFDSIVDRLITSSNEEQGPEVARKLRRYVREVDRVRSLAGKLLPRIMYAQLEEEGCKWSELRFDATAEGRPFLSKPRLQMPADYNVTHDGDWVVMAFHAPSAACHQQSHASISGPAAQLAPSQGPVTALRVGVDVMQLAKPRFEKSVRGFVDTMDMTLTPRERAWCLEAQSTTSSAGDAEMLARLYDLWTHKEAFTKNVGKGLGFDFATIQLDFWLCEPSAERQKRRSTEPILHIKGVPDPAYSFVELQLPVGRWSEGTGSQLVIAEGPWVAGQERPPTQISPALSASEAQSTGLLKIWSIGELVQEATRLRD